MGKVNQNSRRPLATPNVRAVESARRTPKRPSSAVSDRTALAIDKRNKSAKRSATENPRKAPDRKGSVRKATDRKATDRKATERKATERKATARKAGQRDVEVPRYAIRELDPIRVCGARTSVTALFRVDERPVSPPTGRVPRKAAVEGRHVHLVFNDRHGWYCEHGRSCHAVGAVMKHAGIR